MTKLRQSGERSVSSALRNSREAFESFQSHKNSLWHEQKTFAGIRPGKITIIDKTQKMAGKEYEEEKTEIKQITSFVGKHGKEWPFNLPQFDVIPHR